jgi:hypothetical protein
MKNDELDRFISRHLEKNELEIPAVVRDAIRRRVGALAGQPRPLVWKQAKIWWPLLAAASLAIVISISLLFQARTEVKKITQIRTEFSIPEKNIKIIWIQRDDFHFPEKNG